MTTAERPETGHLLIDGYHGWYGLPDDPEDGWRMPSNAQSRVLQLLREADKGSTTIVIFGGAAGGGKSNVLANTPYMIGLENPGTNCLVTRQAMVHLRATTLLEFDECLHPDFQVKRYDSTPTYRDVRKGPWQPWSRVWFRPMDDWMTLMSTAYNYVFIEEGQETAERAFLGLVSRLRHNATDRWGAVVGFNPFPSWPTDWAFNSKIPPEIANEPSVSVHFVPSRIPDNPYLRAGYESMLRAMYSNDPWMLGVLVEGNAEVVPNAVYGMLNDPAMRELMQCYELPEFSMWSRGTTGWDWGTSLAHLAAGVLLGMDKHGLIWVLDAWESPNGSSAELTLQANQWHDMYFEVKTARYDASQGSLRDDLGTKRDSRPLAHGVYEDCEGGVRDVEGRIRTGRGVIATERLRFNWRSAGARKLWAYLLLYHRDEADKIVEVKDDMVDAFHYAIYDLEHPTVDWSKARKPEAHEMKYNFQGPHQKTGFRAKLAQQEQRERQTVKTR